MPLQIKIQQTENKTKLWFVTAQGLVLMTDTVVSLWSISFGKCLAFALYFKSNAEIVMPKKVLKKVLQNLLQFVLRSPSEGAETMLILVDKECSGNDRSKGWVCVLGRGSRVLYSWLSKQHVGVAERDPLESFLAGVPGLLPKEVEWF